MVRVCDSNIIFPSVPRQSICLSRYLLLNHWEEFNQTCYMACTHGKGVREQNYFSVRPSGVRPSVRHAISSQISGRNLTKLTTWLSFMVRLCVRPSVRPSVRHAISNINTECWDLRWRAIDCAFLLLLLS